jgi:hypothetical protein
MIGRKRPSLIRLTEVLSTKSDTILRLSQLKMYPYELSKCMLPYSRLESSFSLYLNEAQSLIEIAMRQGIDDYLLSLKFFCEIKSSEKVFRNSNSGQIYAKLVQLMLQNKYTHKSTLACLVHSLPAYGITTPCFEHIAALLYKGIKTEKVPQLVTFLQKKIAKFTRSAGFVKINDPFAENVPFLIDSFALLSQNFNLKISVQTSSLANAPSIRKGILDCISICNQEKLRNKSIVIQSSDETKLALWKVVLFLWKSVDQYSSIKQIRQ